MAAFPAYLKLLDQGFGKEPASIVNRTPFEDGMVKQAKSRHRGLVVRPVAYHAESNADFQSWETFFNTTINAGADWFDWTDPVDGQVKLARIVEGSYSAYPMTPALENWRISMRIETWSA